MVAKRVAKRDKYGRYKGKAGIKPWKNNLAGVTRKGHANKGARRTTGTARKGMSKKRKAALVGAAVVGTVAVTRGARSANDAIQRKRGYSVMYHNTSFKEANALKKHGFKTDAPKAGSYVPGKANGRYYDDVYVTNKRRGGASKWINGHKSMGTNGGNHVTLRVVKKLPPGALKTDDNYASDAGSYRLRRGEVFNQIDPKHLEGARITRSRYIYGNIAIDSIGKGIGFGARGVGSANRALRGIRIRR